MSSARSSAPEPKAGTIRAALRMPRAARGPLGAMVGRLPLAIGVLVIVAVVHAAGGSYGLAGLASCIFSLAMAAGHPWLGRRIEGPHGGRVLVAAACASAAGWLAIALSVRLLPEWTVVVAAALAGGCQPPLSPAMRARWSELMAPHALERAYAFELTLQEVAFVAGPLLLSLVLALGTPTLAAIACAALVIAGALLFASSRRPPFAPAGRRRRTGTAPMSSPAIRLLAATRGLCSAGLGVGIVCIPAFAVAHGGRALTGVLAAVWSLGSLAGGVIYGAVAWRAPLWRRYLVALGVGTAPIAALPLAPGVPVFAALAIVSGLGLAAWVASGDALAQGFAPAGGRTEAFTWIASLGLVGEALGAVVAGTLLDAAGLRIALAAAGALALGSFLLAFANAGSLRGSAGSGGRFSGCSGTPLLDA